MEEPEVAERVVIEEDPVAEPNAEERAEEEIPVVEEEEECRVCRGPAEEGRPLIGPCKCSGSIGLTHQDCLVSWLEVTRGDGRCELCKTKFRFDPQYQENTPDHLPPSEVLLGLFRRAIVRWLPLTVRLLVAASLWLLVAPFLTACIYHGWIHGPSSIFPRYRSALIGSDIVSGVIIMAIIIISFLSLMSFADFLRAHWQQPQRGQGDANEEPMPHDNVANGFVDNVEVEADVLDEGAVDEHIVLLVEKRPGNNASVGVSLTLEDVVDTLTTPDSSGDDGWTKLPPSDDEEEAKAKAKALASLANDLAELADQIRVESESQTGAATMDRDVDTADEDASAASDPAGVSDEIRRLLDDEEEGPVEDDNAFIDEDNDDNDDEEGPNVEPQPDAEAVNQGFDPMDPVLQDDQVDMEINVALDELLGLRGPLNALVRNLLWLLAFNALYLCIFAFAPKTVGSVVYAGMLNTTMCESILRKLPYMYTEDAQSNHTILTTLSSVNAASASRDTTFRLTDFGTVTLGYLSIATTIVAMRYGWMLFQVLKQRFSVEGAQVSGDGADSIYHGEWSERRVGDREGIPDFDDRDGVDVGANTAIDAALDATVAVVKVGVLLFMKMFLLPLILGLCLDASTMPLFGHTILDRVSFAGGDLFSFMLLHWVAGITFMLLVTVFLLQLREVAHPDLFARLIRPQEPQPDLLGNLMNESVPTHTKRLFWSLGIYAVLLALHISLPIKLLLSSGLADRFTFFRLNFWHVLMPQLQMPLELITFHLSMLALLERYKNAIGSFQHTWLVFMCRKMGLTEYLLPCKVASFEYKGSKEVFVGDLLGSGKEEKRVDPFWYELAAKSSDTDGEGFIEAKFANLPGERLKETDFVTSLRGPIEDVEGESKENGARVLNKDVDCIRLPVDPRVEVVGVREKHTADGTYGVLLRNKIGRYRLKRNSYVDKPVIEIWRESRGDEITRPPAGWDDLRAGGAFVQGRWAWGNERRSVVEGSVAARSHFRDSKNGQQPGALALKVGVLLFLSWIAITMTVLILLSAPLATGRFLHYLFRVPRSYTHDPWAFLIGGCVFFPILSVVVQSVKLADGSPQERMSRWISHFKLPSPKKLAILLESALLWFVVAPLALGVCYEVFAVKTPKWFSGEDPLVDTRSVLISWILGLAVLNTWALFAYFSVFTRPFWARLGNGMLEPPAGDEQNRRPGGNNANARNEVEADVPIAPSSHWQGKGGRVARFFNVWKAAVFDWDWERIDHVTLLEEFARPISRQIASALVGSSLSFQLGLQLIHILARFEQDGVVIPFVGVVERGLFRHVMFRVCMASHVTIQLCSAFRSRLQIWFNAAHAAARDDRYLIGEILMSYNPDEAIVG